MLLADWQSADIGVNRREADDPQAALQPPDGLLLLSYPLHPPRKPTEMRTGHFARLETPALFVHGSLDPFGSMTEMRSALELIPGRTLLLEAEGLGHDLLLRKSVGDLPATIVETFSSFFALKDAAASR
jgi:predicted alpha/beta-hydrolase family hydrolase